MECQKCLMKSQLEGFRCLQLEDPVRYVGAIDVGKLKVVNGLGSNYTRLPTPDSWVVCSQVGFISFEYTLFSHFFSSRKG